MSAAMPINDASTDEENVRWLEPGEGRALFEEQVRAMMQMSGDEFLQKLDRGEFADEDDNRDLTYLIILSDLGR